MNHRLIHARRVKQKLIIVSELSDMAIGSMPALDCMPKCQHIVDNLCVFF